MSISIVRKRSLWAATGLLLTLIACGGGGDGPTDGNNPPAVAGNYNATFTATQATGCQGLVVPGSSTTGVLRVSQSGSAVTLHISDLREEFGSNPVGTLSNSGAFHFGPGVVIIDPSATTPNDEFNATGTFDGTFTGTSMNISFNFTALTCTVVGTIVGQR